MGQKTKYIKIYVMKSKTELVGPIHIIKLPTDEASHLRGTFKNSSSTLSPGNGRAGQVVNQIKKYQLQAHHREEWQQCRSRQH